jgi:hypothetical protein
VISRSTNVRSALRSRQRGFLLDPYRFGAGGGGGPTDPDRASRLLVLHCNGSNGGTTFTDTSTYARTMTVSGTLITSTSDPKFGSACGLVQASGDMVQSSVVSAIGTGAITVAFWCKPTYSGTYGSFFSMGDFNGGGGMQIFVGTSGVAFRTEGTSDLTYGVSLNDGNWHYVKCYLTAGGSRTKAIMVDGTLGASTATTANIGSDNIDIGSIADSGGGFRFSGSFDEVIVSDFADTSTDVPTVELPDA